MFYGTVSVVGGQPLDAINLFSSDHTNAFEQNVSSDRDGNYFAGALSGVPWAVGLGNDNPTNYVYSEPTFSFTGTNLNSGQALQYNFTALPATQRITGHVRLSTGQPVPLVQVFANAIIGSAFYATQIDTDTNGDYTLNVGNNGNWSVSVFIFSVQDSFQWIATKASENKGSLVRHGRVQLAVFVVLNHKATVNRACRHPAGKIHRAEEELRSCFHHGGNRPEGVPFHPIVNENEGLSLRPRFLSLGN